MKKIFLFNIGMDKTALKHKEFLEKLGYKVEIGPNKKENQYLISHCKYYKEAIDKKIFSFASDVYRFYKLSSDTGLYIDLTVILGKNFDQLYSYFEQFDFWAPKLSDRVINTPVLYGNKSIIAKDIFILYKNYCPSKHNNIRNFPISPRIITAYFINKNLVNNNEWYDTINKHKNELFCLGELPKIMNKKTILKQGNASWIDNQLPKWLKKILSKKDWKKFLRKWHKQKTDNLYIKEKILPVIKLLQEYKI